MASDEDDERPVERLFGLTTEEWGGVVTSVVAGVGGLVVTADFPLYVQAPAVLIGLVMGLTVGVSAVRTLS
jgi:hypothetical protein